MLQLREGQWRSSLFQYCEINSWTKWPWWSGRGQLTQCKFQSGVTLIGYILGLGSLSLYMQLRKWWVCGGEPRINPLAALIHRVKGGIGREWHKAVSSRAGWHHPSWYNQRSGLHEPSSPERRGWPMSASWGNSHCCESCLLCMRRICRDFGWAFCCGTPLVSTVTVLVNWDWSAVGAKPRLCDSEQNEDKTKVPAAASGPRWLRRETENEQDKS